ncbi:hypothetical protein UYSO10_0467 [Kosakonia radicincitans]|nr:hypothetical protein UYSO10_0467 [Kosakonia radicincitans]
MQGRFVALILFLSVIFLTKEPSGRADYSCKNVMQVRLLAKPSGQSFLLFLVSLILAEAFQSIKCSTINQTNAV